MSVNWEPLIEIVRNHQRFAIVSHVRPDGDALGSSLGLAGMLRSLGKDVRVVNPSAIPPRYEFLNGEGVGAGVERFNPSASPASLADREVLIIVDLSSWTQLGGMAAWVREFPGVKVVIDHHVSEDDMGAVVLKDTTAEAAGTLVLQAGRALGAPLTREVASPILTAIAMDTGWFAHNSTKPQTFRDAADLADAGADVSEIYRLLFKRHTLGRMKLLGEAMSKLRLDSGGLIAYVALSQEDVRRAGAAPTDTEDLVDFLVSIEGVIVGVFVFELPSGLIKVSLRSRAVDVAALARTLGGGGHIQAAGATVDGTLDANVERVLEMARAAVARRRGQD